MKNKIEANKKNIEKITKRKNGIIFGKFYPIHNGHIEFIEKAKEYVENLYVVICSETNRDEKIFENSNLPKKISPKIRKMFLDKIFENDKNIKILESNEDNIPSYPNGWFEWTEKVKELLLKENIVLDIVFTNEKEDSYNYLKYFKNNEKIVFNSLDAITIDPKRENINISATKIRENPEKYKNYLPSVVRNYLFE